MNPDTARTQVLAAGRTDADATISLSPSLPARLDSGETIQDATLASASVTAGDLTGSRVRYAILGVAGRGGMATVHVARDLELMRRVALKQLADELRDADPARQRFLREVQITAQLDHPYIVPVYGLEVAPGGAPAYAMKLVEGRTLADYLDETRTAYERDERPDEAHSLAARIEHFLKVCDAVDYAHGKGVIHRDLKPANVMLGPHGEIYVMDWGICRLFDRDDPEPTAGESVADSTGGHETEYGAVVGTPRYMSPEQAQGRSNELGPRSDQCALGLMLHELVTLRAPFAGANVAEVMQNAASARRSTVTHLYERRAVAAALRAIIERATRYAPAERYASVRELADDLRRFLRGDAVHALPDSIWQRAQRYVGRHRQAMLLTLLALFALGASSVALQGWRHERAILAQQARDLHERDLIDEVAEHGDHLQLLLLSLQSELESLALAATQLLRHGDPAADARTYFAEDYLSAERRPPDFAMHPGFDFPVSLRWGVWRMAADADRAAVDLQIRRLFHLHAYRNELLTMTRSGFGGGSYGSGMAELRLILESGAWMMFPGRIMESREDPRSTPGYAALRDVEGVQWGTPHVDADGDNVLLPLSAPLRDVDASVAGVISIELVVDFVVRNLLRDEDAHEHRLLLLDSSGRVLASEELLRSADTEGSGEVALEDFGDAALRDHIAREGSGVIETALDGQARLVAFDRVRPLDWTLVLIAPVPAD